MEKKADLKKYEYYVNRELSWLKFEERVLNEATDSKNPLLERFKFLSITASNLDEFFMIRVASLIDMEHAGYDKPDIAGMPPKKQLEKVFAETHSLVEAQYDTYKTLIPLLENKGIEIISDIKKLSVEELDYVNRYFAEKVYPVLTPMAVDSSRPFPLIRNKSLNIGALLQKKKGGEEIEFATVQVPAVLNRLIKIECSQQDRYIMLESVIDYNMDKLFLNYDIICTGAYRIMRNADLTIDEDEAADLLKEIEKKLKRRQWGEAIKLELAADCDERLSKRLVKEFGVNENEVFRISGPLDLTFLMGVYSIEGYGNLRNKKHVPANVPGLSDCKDIFKLIREKDIMLHHPYESFEPVINFIEEAAKDPKVLAIKQTLYRVSGNSPIVKALAKAAENGKQVTVLVELKARFDEENNIVWARMLEQAGCHVIYGLLGLKTHCKITLVVRSEDDGIRRYVHLGTGNYNDSTAKLYTDIGLFTAREEFGEDATAVFNMLSGYSEPQGWNRLSVAPLWLKKKFLALIAHEKENALIGKSASIVAKMNSLCDPDVIEALYEASQAGVQISLIVRGICCLRPGIKGVSENITVRSIVGNFLEHSRIFKFENDGNALYFCASADWMPRNLERRVEIMFPVVDEDLKKKLNHNLTSLLRDNTKAHIMQSDGSYEKVSPGNSEPYSYQESFVKEAKKTDKEENSTGNSRVFTPIYAHDKEK